MEMEQQNNELDPRIQVKKNTISTPHNKQAQPLMDFGVHCAFLRFNLKNFCFFL